MTWIWHRWPPFTSRGFHLQVDNEVRYNHHNRLVRSALSCSQGGVVYGPVLTLSSLLGVLLVSYPWLTSVLPIPLKISRFRATGLISYTPFCIWETDLYPVANIQLSSISFMYYMTILFLFFSSFRWRGQPDLCPV